VPIPCSKLSRDGKMPERFLVQVLRSLVNRGLLRSTCGVAGGYSLSRAPEKISLLDIMEAFDHDLKVNLPVLDGMGQDVRSRVAETLHEMAASARMELRKLSVADLVHVQAPSTADGAAMVKAIPASLPMSESHGYHVQAGDPAIIR
jgi:Rrf2 family protein